MRDGARKGTFRPEATKVTVKEVAELFLAHCKARMERRERMTQKNYKVYEGYVRNCICPDPEWHASKHAKPSLPSGILTKVLAIRPLRN